MNPTPPLPLGDLAIIDLEGPEAERFAQAQFMNDVLALPVGHWHWNGWLNAKGRVQALFALLRLAPGHLRLVLLDAEPEVFVSALSRYLLRSKARLRQRTDLQAHADFEGLQGDGDGEVDRLHIEADDRLALDVSAEGGRRRLCILPGQATPDPVATARWREADLRHGLPRWRSDREHGWTPHMLSLQRLKAFSVKKGCYPGQEIVARTHYLGKAKRQTGWVEGPGLSDGRVLTDRDGRALAEVIGACADASAGLAVGLLDEATPAFAEGHPVTVRPPLGGLARPI